MAQAMEISEKENAINIEETERTESEVSEISEEEDTYFHDINTLLDHGISIDDVKKLKKGGFNTIKGVQMTITKNLLCLGFQEKQLGVILDACSKVSMNNAFMTASEVSDKRKQIFKLSTGSLAFNKLLGGGVEAMAITEVFGEFRTGKTQIAHTLCVTAQMPGPNGYIGGKVIYIDTENTFRPDKIRTIAQRFSLDESTAMENVLYARAYNSEHQYQLLNTVAAKLHEEAGIFKLLIIDSIMALFRVDYTGRGEMADRQAKLAKMLSRLQKISEEYNIAVFVTNQITSDFTVASVVGGNNVNKPVGGNIMAHASTTRVSLAKGDGNRRLATLFDSPDLEENEIEFEITSAGIDDVIRD